MTPEEYMAAVQKAKEEYENEKREIEDQLQRARAKIAKLEKRLAAIHEQSALKAAQLTSAFMGVPGGEVPLPQTPTPRSSPVRKRGEREEMVLNLVRGIASPDVTSKEVEEVWNRRYKDDPISDSTVRSIMDRLEKKGSIQIAQKGGGQGSGIPTRYSPKAQ